jgi:hypothetical protein
MASSSCTSTTPLLQPESEKLSKHNHYLWKAQVRVAIHCAHLQGFLTGEIKAPGVEIVTTGADGKEVKKLNLALDDWEAMDQ